eukprot:9482024-Pyramimonas_sp.AAC.1
MIPKLVAVRDQPPGLPFQPGFADIVRADEERGVRPVLLQQIPHFVRHRLPSVSLAAKAVVNGESDVPPHSRLLPDVEAEVGIGVISTEPRYGPQSRLAGQTPHVLHASRACR